MGQLWLYDAAGRQVVAFGKGDGGYLGSWAPRAGEPAMADVRGFYVSGDGRGAAAAITWLTPDGLMQSELPAAPTPQGVDAAQD